MGTPRFMGAMRGWRGLPYVSINPICFHGRPSDGIDSSFLYDVFLMYDEVASEDGRTKVNTRMK